MANGSSVGQFFFSSLQFSGTNTLQCFTCHKLQALERKIVFNKKIVFFVLSGVSKTFDQKKLKLQKYTKISENDNIQCQNRN